MNNLHLYNKAEHIVLSMNGEGFAFFRWHALKFLGSKCSGGPNSYCLLVWNWGQDNKARR